MAVNIGPKIGIDGEAQFRKEINGIIQQSKTLASEMKAVTSAFDKNDKSQEAVTAQSKVLTKQIETQQQRIAKLKEGLEAATKQFGEADSRTQKWQQAVNEATTGLNKMERDLSDLESGVDGVSDAMEEASKDAASFGDVLKANLLSEAIFAGVKKLGSAIKNELSYAFDVGSNFASGMSEVKAIMGASAEDVKRLSDKAKEMGASTVFSASQSAEALKYMAMAGWSADDAIAGLDGVMNLAAASGEALGTTSDIVTDAMTAFGLSAKDASHFADVLAKASSSSNTNVGMMGDTFKYVAPVAGAMGYSIEDVGVAIGLMANSGIKASQAGTQLRTLLANMAKPTDQVAYDMEQLGISLTDSSGEMLSFNDIMVDLRESFSGLSEVQKTQYAASLAGKEGMSGLLAIVNAAPEDFDALRDAINNSDGTALNMANTMTDNLPGAITIAKSALEGLGIQIYESFADEAQGAVESFSEAVSEFTASVDWDAFAASVSNFISTIIENGPQIVSVVAGIGAGFVAWNVVTMIQGVVGAIKAFKTANEGATVAQLLLNAAQNANPMAIIVTLIAGVTTAIITLWNTNEDFRNAVIEIGNSIKDAVSNVVKSVVDFFTVKIPSAFRSMVQTIKDNVNVIKNAFSNMVDGIKNTVGNIKSTVVDGIRGAVDYIKGLPGQAIEWGKDFIGGFVDGIRSMIGRVVDAVKSVADTVTSWLHFSRPDVGPLRKYEEWMPDMMMGLSKGIRNNSWRLEDALNAATSNLQANVNVASLPAASGGMSMGGVNITINPAPGMDVNALADMVAYKIEAMTRRKAATW